MNSGSANFPILRALALTMALATVSGMVYPRLARAEGAAPLTRRDTTRARGAKKSEGFSATQQAHRRVLGARVEKRFELKKLFRERGISYPASELFIRIFKRERVLEVWARSINQTEFALLKSYPICALAGQAGPKRAQGDGQTPEGFYYIDDFNPSSDFLLSLHIDYPNRSDQLLNPGKNLGGSIYIHGGCQTEGCMAVTDDAIKELYWLAVEARDVGQQRIPVHIFPAKMSDQTLFQLVDVFDAQPDLVRFWANLKPTHDYFESTRRLPTISIDHRGRYHMKPMELLGVPAVATDSAAAKAAPKVNGEATESRTGSPGVK